MTDITVDGKKVKKANFHFVGEDGERMWIHFDLEDGSKIQSYYFKGVT